MNKEFAMNEPAGIPQAYITVSKAMDRCRADLREAVFQALTNCRREIERDLAAPAAQGAPEIRRVLERTIEDCGTQLDAMVSAGMAHLDSSVRLAVATAMAHRDP